MVYPARSLGIARTALSAPAEPTFLFRDSEMALSGPSAAMSQLMGQVRRVAPYFRTALLTGERGCGEEAVARLLHRLSPLAGRSYLVLTSEEAERHFGDGRISEHTASEGMLYLPRPEQVPAVAQRALLRLLRERGPNSPRVVAFAERGLRSLVSMGAFSAELADSLGALRISLPPLRDRPEDLPGLLRAMLRDQAQKLGMPAPPELGADLLAALSKQTWPGNFDQLRTAALGLLELGAGVELRASHLLAVLGATPEPPRRDRREIRMVTLDRVIQEHLRAVLFACNGNKLRAAEVLGISRSTLYRMLENKPQSDPLAEIERDLPESSASVGRLRVAV